MSLDIYRGESARLHYARATCERSGNPIEVYARPSRVWQFLGQLAGLVAFLVIALGALAIL